MLLGEQERLKLDRLVPDGSASVPSGCAGRALSVRCSGLEVRGCRGGKSKFKLGVSREACECLPRLWWEWFVLSTALEKRALAWWSGLWVSGRNKPCTGLRAEGLLLLGLLSYLLPLAGSCSTRISCGVGFKLFVVMVVIQAVPCDCCSCC